MRGDLPEHGVRTRQAGRAGRVHRLRPGVGVLDDFKKDIPTAFFMEGVTEQNLVGVAAGMAMEGTSCT